MADREANGRFAKGNKITGGRPKLGYSLADIMREALSEPDPNAPARTKFQAIIETLINNAMLGDIPSIHVILNRVYGKEIDIIKLDKSDEIDLSGFSDEELFLYRKLLDKAQVQ